MKILDLQNEFRELVTQFRNEIEASSAMGHFDTHKVSENVMGGLLRELCNWPDLHNLNTEQSNFPGIDLADDTARVAVQVTATADIAKIKHTIEKFVSHNLHQRYDRLIVYVLTTKQGSYSQAAIDTASEGKIQFIANQDIWDYQELCFKAADATPQKLQAAINHLKAYLRGVPVGLADEDIDPPLHPPEIIATNLVAIGIPESLYIAQLSSELIEQHGKRREGRWRKTIREFNQDVQRRIPSAYVIHGRTLITFFDLTDNNNPYHHLIEEGTAEEHRSQDFCSIDEDHERVFKSLLRFSLQHRLFQERVHWEIDEKAFVFLPLENIHDQREEVWQGEKKAKRSVFVRKYNKNDSAKIYMQKHLSFSVDFLLFDKDWFMSITPSWFFSYGSDFKKSGFGHDNLSWVKRRENNQQVTNHFRFIAAWLGALDEVDLFSDAKPRDAFISFGDILSMGGAPSLDESKWAALPAPSEYEPEQRSRLFG